MDQKFAPQAKPEQQLRLSPRQMQSLQLLAMNTQQLEDYLQQQTQENPLLEAGEAEPLAHAADFAISFVAWNQENAVQRMSFEDVSLAGWLSMQVDYSRLRPSTARAVRVLLVALDEDGYLRQPLAELAPLCQAAESDLAEALAIVQQLEPAGVGARDVAECLRLQIPPGHQHAALLQTLISAHLAELAAGEFTRIASAQDVPEEVVRQLAAELRTFDPHPGLSVHKQDARDTVHYLTPDFRIWLEKGQLHGEVLRNFGDGLMLSPCYGQMINDPAVAAADREYLRQQQKEAAQLLAGLSNRRQTLTKVLHCIMQEQRAFFSDGASALRPLGLKQLAEQTGLHTSTVGRAVYGKYADTPFGVVPMRSFFCGAMPHLSGQPVSTTHLQTKIAEIIAAEDKRSPLSDQQIIVILDRLGYRVARRTVAKYRQVLGLPNTAQRRKTDKG